MATYPNGLRGRLVRPHEEPPSGRHLLGRVAFLDHHRPPAVRDGVADMGVHLARDESALVTEVWETDAPPTSGMYRDLVYAHDGEYLFCAGQIPEGGSYREPVREAYDAAFDLISELGYPHVIRIWHFINDINRANADGMEIYRDFCLGRAEAVDRRLGPAGEMPAATGIGSLGGGISWYLLTSRSGRVRHLENPLQVPAPSYPHRYGPRPPKFARATSLSPPGLDGAGDIFVAGTASILGHETVHEGDVAKQCDVTLANMAKVLSRENLLAHGIDDGRTLKDLRLVKVYLRHEEDLEAVRSACAEAFSDTAEIVYFTVDICRSDLLVEIEGIAPRPTA
ncbi:pteridine-dependent deoxygenase [Nonomuraea recticatena]|uniref:Pteridine-dependent deoxygenase n=2 Tax=Nonomuraea recticatena TaxID=46178 RepID=A0ABN3SLJ5_9ACTN